MEKIFLKMLTVVIPAITGCSLFIANLEQKPAGRFDGLDRTSVEKKLGSPLQDCRDLDGLFECEYEYVYYDCEPNDNFTNKTFNSLDILEKDMKSLFVFEFFATPYLLYKCRNKEVVIVRYNNNDEVIYGNSLNSPIDQSQARMSDLGSVKVKYDTYLLSIPGFGGYEVVNITDTTELEAIKETDYWVYVKTSDGKEGWIAKKWIK